MHESWQRAQRRTCRPSSPNQHSSGLILPLNEVDDALHSTLPCAHICHATQLIQLAAAAVRTPRVGDVARGWLGTWLSGQVHL